MLNRISKGAVAAAALIVAGPGMLSAADAPRSAPPPPAAQVFSPALAMDWTGFYLGVHGAWSELTVEPAGGSNSIAGLGAGVQAGYNWQFDPNWVVGVEADYTFTDMDGSTSLAPGVVYHTELDGFATLRARLGYAIDRVLVYGTGGLAYGDVDSQVITTGISDNGAQWGWTIGGGVEGMLTPNVTARAEYLYYDLGSVSAPAGGDIDGHMVRVGLNYKFN